MQPSSYRPDIPDKLIVLTLLMRTEKLHRDKTPVTLVTGKLFHPHIVCAFHVTFQKFFILSTERTIVKTAVQQVASVMTLLVRSCNEKGKHITCLTTVHLTREPVLRNETYRHNRP